jgi:hypothetical protein
MPKTTRTNTTAPALHADEQLDRRLVEEINILRLEGRVFCFDPREARQRKGKLIATDEHGQSVTVELHPSYGQPSVLAYKILQTIFLKVTEEGYALIEGGRAVYSDTANFSQRELALLVGRSWSGKTSRELFDALQQLQTTRVIASLYEKDTKAWQSASFYLLPSVFLAGHGETITRCSVRLAPEIMTSLNKRHVAFFNLYRLSLLEPIGLVLYKRFFFHLSNLNDTTRSRRSLMFRKDYETLCREWLGGLKPQRYCSRISQQLSPHLDALKATGLLRRWAIEKNAAGDGYNVSVWPGAGFFEDYQLYYLDAQQPRLRFKASAGLREIQTPLELVAFFHRELGHTSTTFEEHETAYADELLARFSEREVRDLIRYSIAGAKETRFEMLYFGALKRYVEPWSADAARRRERNALGEQIKACSFCNEAGYLELRERLTHRFFVLECPHRPAEIATILDQRDAERL